MKVLLFVQNGDARPKALKCPNEYASRPDRLAGHIRAWAGKSQDCVRAVNGSVFASACFADCWWLVECMDAKHGRGIVEHKIKYGEDAVPPAVGRILASGGRS